jgi:ABC-type lipoprotein export system ATPase subunit
MQQSQIFLITWLIIDRRENPGGSVEPIILLRSVYKSYKTPAGEIPALREINLSVQNGEFVAVIGKSGAGKSTLVNMITGIDEPDRGEIAIKGVLLHEMNQDQRARWRGRQMGVVFQFFQLMPSIDLIRNVIFPMEFCGIYTGRERWDRSIQLLEQVGLTEHMRKKPAYISGGQQQRVAIARALANDPPILIADEPTGNLDLKTSCEIMDLFSRLSEQGKTILIATHDKAVAERAQRVVEIVDGEIR